MFPLELEEEELDEEGRRPDEQKQLKFLVLVSNLTGFVLLFDAVTTSLELSELTLPTAAM